MLKKSKLKNQNAKIIVRLHRIRGQLEGIEKMLLSDKTCLEIVQQIAAVRSALAKVQGLILISSCKNKNNENFNKKIQELTKIL